MKNIKPHSDDSLRPEYRRADFGEMVQGKYATSHVDFAEIVHLLLACVGEDEDVTLNYCSPSDNFAPHQPGDWTCEIDNANQITLRYWLGECENIDEPISNARCVLSLQQRTELYQLLVQHTRCLKARVAGLK